jgi:uncharacterized membrane protein YfhO
VFEDPNIGEPLETWREQPCLAPDRLRMVSRVPDQAVFEAELGCPGLVVVGDPYYRGWRAWVDGQRVPIQEFEGARRAVRAAAGRHRVEFAYQPASVYWGLGCTALGLVLLVTLRRCRWISSRLD